ncbi:response regulator [Candidatus Woesearchaeota archaeon]|nr:response regulator [Candidatus Woesearchaeota archaeon]
MKRIAVVDDNDDLLFTVKFGLKNVDKSLKVETFNDPVKFLEVCQKEKFDLILLDIMMPQLDGWDTFVEITQSKVNKKTPIVFLTAKTDKQSVIIGMAGAKGYITKPFTVPDLLEQIEKYLGKK